MTPHEAMTLAIRMEADAPFTSDDGVFALRLEDNLRRLGFRIEGTDDVTCRSCFEAVRWDAEAEEYVHLVPMRHRPKPKVVA